MEQAQEEYGKAQKLGQKEFRDLTAQGIRPEPVVLDELLSPSRPYTTNDIGLVDIPMNLIVGTKTGGRITAFSAGFFPMLPHTSEFAHKWMNLCAAHLSDVGIHDPIECFEYLGKFYIQEGNKRVSVLKYFGSPTIAGNVRRILPPVSDDPRIKSYYEFIDFFNSAKIYDVQFRTPGSYTKLLSYLGKDPKETWSEREQRTFRAYFQYFREAFESVQMHFPELLPEEALLVWLEVHPFLSLGKMSTAKIKSSILALKEDISSMTKTAVHVQTAPDTEAKVGLLNAIINVPPSHLNVAFVHQLDPTVSAWSKGHEEGAQHLMKTFPKRVSVRSYYHADSPEEADALLTQAVEDGAQLVFTTTPKLSRSTLKAAVNYPKVKFFNCAVDIPYSSVRAYYGRIFEGKFITGAIAGAMANNDLIGYVGSYPTFGVPASINAFALGAQLTNPRAKIELRWSCLPGTPVQDFIEKGMQVISNRDFPTARQMYLDHGSYGTYQVAENGELIPLGSPVWIWGRFYVKVVNAILNGTWDQGKDHQAINYWWGMDSGVIDVKLSERLPEGVRTMANLLRRDLQCGILDPFRRKLVTQDGTVKSYGERSLTTEELLHMDWLCDNIVGSIPTYDQVLPIAQSMVRSLGLYRDQIPPEKEGAL